LSENTNGRPEKNQLRRWWITYRPGKGQKQLPEDIGRDHGVLRWELTGRVKGLQRKGVFST